MSAQLVYVKTPKGIEEINSRSYGGGMGSSLLNQLDKYTNLNELRVHYKAWQDAILLSSDGRKQAEDLKNRLAALLS